MFAPETDQPVFLSGVWCHASPAPDKVRSRNPARALLHPQAGRDRTSSAGAGGRKMLTADHRDGGGSFGRAIDAGWLASFHQDLRIERWAMKKIRAPRSTGNNLFNGPRPQDP